MPKAYTRCTIRDACLAHTFSHIVLVPESIPQELGKEPWLCDGEGSGQRLRQFRYDAGTARADEMGIAHELLLPI